MKIHVHIGPHKTGTTSIQSYLAARFGSEAPSSEIWYPLLTRRPSHVDLANWFIRSPVKPEGLRDILASAYQNGTQRMLISAEDLHLMTRRGGLDEFAHELRDHEVILVTTQSSFAARIASQWQERLKHGDVRGLPEILPLFKKGVIGDPSYLSKLAYSLAPSEVVIICSSRNSPPERLIRDLTAGFDLPPSRTEALVGNISANIGMGRLEADLLRMLNERYLDLVPEGERKDQTLRMLSASLRRTFSTRDWKSMAPEIPIEIGIAGRQLAVDSAQAFEVEVGNLRNAFPVRLVGDPSFLAEGL